MPFPNETYDYYRNVENKTHEEAIRLAREEHEKQQAKKKSSAENNPRPMPRNWKV